MCQLSVWENYHSERVKISNGSQQHIPTQSFCFLLLPLKHNQQETNMQLHMKISCVISTTVRNLVPVSLRTRLRLYWESGKMK